MKIILATPIYSPEIGGPSIYVKNLEQGLKAKEIETQVFSYNNIKKYPQPLRFLIYFISLIKKSKDCDLIYAFNLISCGFPAYFASRLRNKKFLIRLGGDFLWERAIESGRTNKTLKEYYKEPKTLREKFRILIIRKILNSANKIIFTSNFQKEIYKAHYGVKKNNTIVIPNPFPELNVGFSRLPSLRGASSAERATRQSHSQTRKVYNNRINGQPSVIYELLYAGRFIKLKNLPFLMDVFAEILKETSWPLRFRIIGEGPEEYNLRRKIKQLKLENYISIEKSIPHQELLREIQKSYLCVLPALTDITPNFALDCIKLRKPILLTRETEYFETFRNDLIFIDPCDRNDIENKILYLLNKNNYSNYVEKIRKIPTDYSWNNVIEKYIFLFKNLGVFL